MHKFFMELAGISFPGALPWSHNPARDHACRTGHVSDSVSNHNNVLFTFCGSHERVGSKVTYEPQWISLTGI